MVFFPRRNDDNNCDIPVVAMPPPTLTNVAKNPIVVTEDVTFAEAELIPLSPPSTSYHDLEVIPCDPVALASHQRPREASEDEELLGLDPSVLDTLKQQGFSLGLAQSLVEVKKAFAKRIFIIDNSGSMQLNDGHRISHLPNQQHSAAVMRVVPCTRWEEIRECIQYHISLTGLLEAPSSFRLLNHPGAMIRTQIFGVAENLSDHNMEENRNRVAAEVQLGLEVMDQTKPAGTTPLTDHIHAIYQEIYSWAAYLQSTGQKISITIATDGLPTDAFGRGGPAQNQAFVDSMRQLEGLPVWIVIRICSDEDSVVSFYNELDSQLEVSIEVIDDFIGEAQEVHATNPWLNYGLPLHRLRELGFHDRVLDLLDERALTTQEVFTVCQLLFGKSKMQDVPDPNIDWKGFLKAIGQIQKTEEMLWNPVKNRLQPWLNIKTLDFLYGDDMHLPCRPLQLFHCGAFLCMS